MTFDEAHRRIKRGDGYAINQALKNGLDPNLANQFGWTLLMLTAMSGGIRIGEALLNHGARVNAPNDSGDTALSLAAHSGHLKFIRLLLSVGATTDCRPHGHDMPSWIKLSSGLPDDKLAQVLTLIGHKAHLN
jgi:ankyrin repeat protein